MAFAGEFFVRPALSAYPAPVSHFIRFSLLLLSKNAVESARHERAVILSAAGAKF
jgi:hypothetical protein